MMQKPNTMKNFKLKNLSILLFFCLLATTLVACKSAGVVPPKTIETTNTVTKTEVVRDTVFKIQKDSSYYKAYLECVNGKVVLNPQAKPEIKKGKHLKPPKVNIKDNIITVNCEAEAQELFAQWKDIYMATNLQTTITNTVEVERKLTWWQSFQIWCGRIFLAIALFSVVKFLLKIYKPI